MLNEKKLVEKLDKILKKEFGTNLSFREFSAGYGIADLVFAQGYSFKKNLKRKSPITNFNCLKLLLSLDTKKIYHIDELANILPHLTDNEIKKQIKNLINNNYLESPEKNYYKKIVDDKLNPIKKVIAIEVKLNDHKNGLIQARRYQYFADESYLAILKEAKKNINFDEFNKYNIGLILFDNKLNSIEIIEPKRKNGSYEANISLFAKEMMMERFIKSSS